jgi:hypothetical protein
MSKRSYLNRWEIYYYDVVLLQPIIDPAGLLFFVGRYKNIRSVIKLSIDLPFSLPSKNGDGNFDLYEDYASEPWEVIRTRALANKKGVIGCGEVWDVFDGCQEYNMEDHSAVLKQSKLRERRMVEKLGEIPDARVEVVLETEDAFDERVYYKALDFYIKSEIKKSEGEVDSWGAMENFARRFYSKQIKLLNQEESSPVPNLGSI